MLKYIFILHSGGPILKILITDGLSQEGLDLFANYSQISLDVRKKTEREELKTIIKIYASEPSKVKKLLTQINPRKNYQDLKNHKKYKRKQ